MLAAASAFAQGDGARNYQLVPDGTKSVTAYGIHALGNQSADGSTVNPDADVHANLSVLQYTQTFSVSDRQLQVIASLPFGRISGTVNRLSFSSSGIGDAQIAAMLGLVGAPALADKEYAAFTPGFTLGALGKIFAPTGEYDSSKPLSIGANRWAFQLGAPMAQYIGKSFLDPALGSLELLPTVTFFTRNNDLRNANTRQQDPLYKLEGHATRNLNETFWVSADAFYVRGGETITDGVRDGNAQRWASVGGTAALAWKSSLFALSYGQVINRNGATARGLRAEASYAF